MQPVINKRRCPAQDQICKAIPVCPRGAIRYVADATERLGGKIVIDESLCDGCAACVTACCGSAIEMR